MVNLQTNVMTDGLGFLAGLRNRFLRSVSSTQRRNVMNSDTAATVEEQPFSTVILEGDEIKLATLEGVQGPFHIGFVGMNREYLEFFYRDSHVQLFFDGTPPVDTFPAEVGYCSAQRRSGGPVIVSPTHRSVMRSNLALFFNHRVCDEPWILRVVPPRNTAIDFTKGFLK